MTKKRRADDGARRLAQIDELLAAGALTPEQAREARARLGSATPEPTTSAQRPSRRLIAGIAAFTVVLAAAGYAWLGNPGAIGSAAGDADSRPHAGQAETEAMLARLAERLAAKPDDAEGWSMLGRSYLVMGRHAEAVAALEKLRALRPDDAQVLADLADAKAMLAGRKLDGEPEQLIRRALELDPRNLKALALAGTMAFDRSDFAQAVRHWESAVALAGVGDELANNLRAGIAEARSRGNLPAPAAVAGSGVPATAPQLQGRVTLAPALAAQASASDTLFVFARAVDGPRIPLAMIKRQAGELPFEFSLDDSSAMNPSLRLSQAAQVVVGARISKSGQAVAQPGDLQGFSQPVTPGARGIRVEIGEIVK